MEQDIKILEDYIYNKKETMKEQLVKAIEHLIKAYKELEEENEELISDNLDYQRTLDIFDKRTYRKKYLEERRKEEPNLLYPDADEIYKRYYKLREENKELKKDNKRYEKELHDVIEFSIPVSLVEEKIEELNNSIDLAIDNSKGGLDEEFIEKGSKMLAQNKILQELLEKRK